MLKINYKQIIDDVFYGVHQSLGYFMIGYEIGENMGIISIYNTDDTFNLDKTKLICEYDYFRDELRLHKDIDIELGSYLVNEIFYKIQKEIKRIKKYLVEKVDE